PLPLGRDGTLDRRIAVGGELGAIAVGAVERDVAGGKSRLGVREPLGECLTRQLRLFELLFETGRELTWLDPRLADERRLVATRLTPRRRVVRERTHP